MSEQDVRDRDVVKGVTAGVAAAGAHLFAVVVLAVIFSLPFVDGSTWQMMSAALTRPSFRLDILPEVLLHLGLASCAWALVVIGFRYVREHRKEKLQMALKRAKGTIMTELLIILVPFLLLTSGLAQLAILNIAQVLGHLAAYNVGRTYMVWEPEGSTSRWGVNNGTVDDRARLAAAAAFAPAAPGHFTMSGTGDAQVRALAGTMYTMFDVGMGSLNAGSDSISAAMGAVGTGPSADPTNTDYWTAFDTNTFSVRAAKKLTFAYLATEVNRTGATSAQIRYQQNIVFPWFAYIWGTDTSVGGRDGYYLEIKRSVSFPKQVSLP